ncbi:hypothetical protein JANAI62_30310 [Jannaschia pagri]|uniref:Lipoprotein n=1 Tax=Jannaschia pagri TaxID=2829797 RepID=A0ABQ4NPW0_9RHOB|nr:MULTISPECIES: hypothetical protein [unclassified Jannaschia]GIT92732.1 hypothetical protein JANAI61_31900 [Jannaschia sp. AI_61]GIT96408.1 hypothetical protein JANAI62_30310 [Jannaschia sp. AI_62]
MKSILLATTVLALTGCASVVPGTALLASRMDPLTADPADIAAFPILPEGIGLLADESVLVLSGVRQSDGISHAETFILSPWQGGYRIDPEDYERFRDQQVRLINWSEEVGLDGSLGITLAPCLIGRGPDADARYSVDVILRQGGARLPLLKDAPLKDIIEAFGEMSQCPGG